MKFVVEVNDRSYPISEIDESSFREASKVDITGVPVYFTTVNSVSYFWPRPMKEFKIFRLEPWEYADGRLT